MKFVLLLSFGLVGCVNYGEMRSQADHDFTRLIVNDELLILSPKYQQGFIDCSGLEGKKFYDCFQVSGADYDAALSKKYRFGDIDACLNNADLATSSDRGWELLVNEDVSLPNEKVSKEYFYWYAYEYLIKKSHNENLKNRHRDYMGEIDRLEQNQRNAWINAGNAAGQYNMQQENQRLKQSNQRHEYNKWKKQNDNSRVKMPQSN